MTAKAPAKIKPRKTVDKVWICGGEEYGTYTTVPLDHRYDRCPEAANHAPMPDGYMGWHGAAQRRGRAGQRQKRCPGCGLFTLWTGGKEVPGWPRFAGQQVAVETT